MRLDKRIKSSGAKLALLYLAIVLIATGISATAAYLIIRKELETRDVVLLEHYVDLFEKTYQNDGTQGLIAALDTHIAATLNFESVFRLTDDAGNALATNFRPILPLPEHGKVPSSVLGFNEDYAYFVETRKIGTMLLVVGISGEDISEIQEVFVDAALWGAVLLIAISFLGAVILSANANRRIAQIGEALQAVDAGQLEVRIPTSGQDNDIDRAVQLMNRTISTLGTYVETNKQISSDIAHDLKTPLNRLRIDIEQALQREEEGESVAPELARMEAECDSILKTFDALLRIAQIESGVRKERFAKVSLECVCYTVADFYSIYADDVGAQLNVDIQSEIPPIDGDRELLTQMISNLLENALKHAGNRPKIDCLAYVREDRVCLELRDNGPGIPATERAKVLRRLYRLEKSRSRPGSGLGLSMVKAICDLHDATLTLDDNHPGLVVRVQFPFAQ